MPVPKFPTGGADLKNVIRLSVLLWSANILLAQSHPGWWTYASPDSTALVGIDWRTFANSPFGDALGSELGADGLGFPSLDCVHQVDQILISSPPLLAAAPQSCSAAQIAQQASKQKFQAFTYKNVNLWIASQPSTLSIALITPQVILLGSPKALQDAIDRAADVVGKDTDSARSTIRKYSPLLARAAQFSHNADLWVVASKLPDPLASRFVPFDVEARSFEGSVSMRDGLWLAGILYARSSEAALVTAEHLRSTFAALPPFARATEVRVDKEQIVISLSATVEQLNASLREAPAAAPAPAQTPAPALPPVILPSVAKAEVTAASAKPPTIAQPKVALAPPAPPPTALLSTERPPAPVSQIPAAAPAPVRQVKPETAAPAERQVIRIIGLDDGPREIPLPPSAEAHQ